MHSVLQQLLEGARLGGPAGETSADPGDQGDGEPAASPALRGGKNCNENSCHRASRRAGHRAERLRQLLGRRAATLTFDDQLTAGGADVPAAALADRDEHAAVGENAANWSTAVSDGRSNGMPGAAFRGIRLTLPLIPAGVRTRRRASSGVSFTPVQQHVLERDPAALGEGKRRARGEDVAHRVLLGRRHQGLALRLGRGVQRDRQVWHQRLGRQPIQHRHQPDRREGHPPGAQPRPCSSASSRSAFIVSS